MTWTEILAGIVAVLASLSPLFIGLITAFGLYIFGPTILSMWAKLIWAVKKTVK